LDVEALVLDVVDALTVSGAGFGAAFGRPLPPLVDLFRAARISCEEGHFSA
jgi:hypothetical protein